MCLPLSGPRSNFFKLSNIVYHIDSTHCVLSLFFQHKDDKTIVCPECYSAKTGTDKTSLGIFRHYIHFGNILPF